MTPMSTTDFADDLRTELLRSDRPATDAPGGRTARIAWLTIGGLLAAAALFWGTMNVIGVLAHGERQEDFTFAAEDVRAVDIESEDGSITVIAEPVDTVTVSAAVSNGLIATDVDAQIVSGVLEVRGRCPALAAVWCAADFTVSVPADRPITVDASNGSVLIRDSTARLDIDNDNGSIDLEGVTGQIRIRNDNGRVVGRRARPVSLFPLSQWQRAYQRSGHGPRRDHNPKGQRAAGCPAGRTRRGRGRSA